jgi:hypothetical protein
MEKGFNGHPESLRNSNLFLETAEDMGVIVEIYPAFSGGKTIYQGIQERNDDTILPDPARRNSFHSIEHLPGPEDDWSKLEGSLGVRNE